MKILPIPIIPESLREAAKLGLVVPFVGAGVSLIAGCPSWSQFADDALRLLVEKQAFTYGQLDQIRNLSPRVRLSLARIAAQAHATPIDFKALIHPESFAPNPKGAKIYSPLLRLGRVFVTTNYDRWLDDGILSVHEAIGGSAATPSAVPMRVVPKVNDLQPKLLHQDNTVVHLHGSVQDPESMVVTTHDYLRHYANDRGRGDADGENRVLTFLEALFRERTVLFVGYGLEELELLEYVVLKGAKPLSDSGRLKEAPRHFMLQGFFSYQKELADSLANYFRSECGIELLPFSLDDKNWEQLIDVLEFFAQELPAATPPLLGKVEEMERLLDE